MHFNMAAIRWRFVAFFSDSFLEFFSTPDNLIRVGADVAPEEKGPAEAMKVQTSERTDNGLSVRRSSPAGGGGGGGEEKETRVEEEEEEVMVFITAAQPREPGQAF